MEELKRIDEEFNELIQKRKQNDINICYINIENINNLINRINQLDNPIINNRKNELIEIYKKEIKMNIYYIINLSYIYFMDNININEDYKSVLLNIKKSKFYTKYKNDIKIIRMEIYYMMEELKINNDYFNVLIKLKEIIKDIYDLELINEIKELIKYCEIYYINNEKKEINKLLDQNEYLKAKLKYEKLLNEYKDNNMYKNIKKEYNCLLKNLNNYKIII
jgi:hypothetical protein